jgi:MSHA biogenesis protein MshJ
MKQSWEKFLLKFDSLSLKDRVIVALALSMLFSYIAYAIWISPVEDKMKALSTQINAEKSKLVALNAEIKQKIALGSKDPDVIEKERLAKIKTDIERLHETLREKQKGLVSPDQMAKLVESIVKQNGKLNLIGLKTLPVASLNESKKKSDPPGQMTEKEKAFIENSLGRKLEGVEPSKIVERKELLIDQVYKHGVELTLEGNYLDMLKYMDDVKSMPWQLFWGGANLKVDAYPKSTLTLTLFTLSLDKRWLYL